MTISSASWTDVSQTVIVGVQLVFLAVAAVVGLRQVREARRLREEQTRPFVVIDFDAEPALLFLTVSNIGNTLARDVRFHVDPTFATAIDIPIDELKIFQEGISTLPPGGPLRRDKAGQKHEKPKPDNDQNLGSGYGKAHAWITSRDRSRRNRTVRFCGHDEKW